MVTYNNAEKKCRILKSLSQPQAFARVATFSRLIEFPNILQSFKSSLSFPVSKLFLISYKKKKTCKIGHQLD